MLNAIALLLICQLMGEMIVRLIGLPLPGPVIGMLLLFGWLTWRGHSFKALETTTEGLLRYLALLFVPAGVGVMVHLQDLSGQWVALVVTLIASIVITLLVTGWVMQWMLKRMHEKDQHVS